MTASISSANIPYFPVSVTPFALWISALRGTKLFISSAESRTMTQSFASVSICGKHSGKSVISIPSVTSVFLVGEAASSFGNRVFLETVRILQDLGSREENCLIFIDHGPKLLLAIISPISSATSLCKACIIVSLSFLFFHSSPPCTVT